MSQRRLEGAPRAGDAAVCAALFAGTLLYLYFWPRDFYLFDEGIYVHEPQRILDGDVMYRDFFEIITPGWPYLMALLYKLFGVGLQTARAAMAVLHGLLAVCVYLTCRRAGVRSALAALAGMGHLTLSYPMVPITSAHWLATLATMALTLSVVGGPARTPRRSLWWGVLCGAVILVQQQKGMPMAAGAGVVLLSDGARGRSLVACAAGFALGILLSAGVVMAVFLLLAGAQSVVDALVVQPMFHYTALHNPAQNWMRFLAGLGVPTAESAALAKLAQAIDPIIPTARALNFLPLVIPAAALTALGRAALGGAPWRALRVLLLLSTFGLLSIAYYPDAIHFAYLTPLWLCLAAVLSEAVARRCDGAPQPVRLLGAALLGCAIVGACVQLADNLHKRRANTGGGNSYSAAQQGLSEEMRKRGVREVFFYPAVPGLYLLTGAKNPTRFEIVLPGYTTVEQQREIIADLETRRVPLLVRAPFLSLKGLEPLTEYIRRHYARAPLPAALMRQGYVVFERRERPLADGGL